MTYKKFNENGDFTLGDFRIDNAKISRGKDSPVLTSLPVFCDQSIPMEPKMLPVIGLVQRTNTCRSCLPYYARNFGMPPSRSLPRLRAGVARTLVGPLSTQRSCHLYSLQANGSSPLRPPHTYNYNRELPKLPRVAGPIAFLIVIVCLVIDKHALLLSVVIATERAHTWRTDLTVFFNELLSTDRTYRINSYVALTILNWSGSSGMLLGAQQRMERSVKTTAGHSTWDYERRRDASAVQDRGPRSNFRFFRRYGSSRTAVARRTFAEGNVPPSLHQVLLQTNLVVLACQFPRPYPSPPSLQPPYFSCPAKPAAALPKANRVGFPMGPLPDFRKWESCQTVPPFGGLSRGSSVSPSPFIPALVHTHTRFTLDSCKDHDVKRRPDLFNSLGWRTAKLCNAGVPDVFGRSLVRWTCKRPGGIFRWRTRNARVEMCASDIAEFPLKLSPRASFPPLCPRSTRRIALHLTSGHVENALSLPRCEYSGKSAQSVGAASGKRIAIIEKRKIWRKERKFYDPCQTYFRPITEVVETHGNLQFSLSLNNNANFAQVRAGKEYVTACGEERPQHSLGVILGNCGKRDSRTAGLVSNSGPPACESNLSLRHLEDHAESKSPISNTTVTPVLEGCGGVVVRLLASQQGDPASVPGGVTLRFVVLDDDVGRRVFSGVSRLPRPCIPALLHPHRPSKSLYSLTTPVLLVPVIGHAFSTTEVPRSDFNVERGDSEVNYVKQTTRGCQRNVGRVVRHEGGPTRRRGGVLLVDGRQRCPDDVECVCIVDDDNGAKRRTCRCVYWDGDRGVPDDSDVCGNVLYGDRGCQTRRRVVCNCDYDRGCQDDVIVCMWTDDMRVQRHESDLCVFIVDGTTEGARRRRTCADVYLDGRQRVPND
ncbi:hypothetical protein PR048_022869, partial [Dryococelus australis]